MPVNNRVIISSIIPEGVVKANKGIFCISTSTNSVYIKVEGNNNESTGWHNLVVRGLYKGVEPPYDSITAPYLAYYLNETDNTLYIQTNDTSVPTNTGWVLASEGAIYIEDRDPNKIGLIGATGDLCINSLDNLAYLKVNAEWLALPEYNIDSSDALINLAQLLTNVTEVTDAYFNLFFNPNPMDITVSQYNKEGKLDTYIIPNRAKDRQAILGEGSPENILDSPIGALYLDTIQRVLYIKTTNSGNSEGWKAVLYEGNFQEPLVVDESTGKLSIKIDDIPTFGSQNVVSSNGLYATFEKKADLNGNEAQIFKVAYPVDESNAVNIEYMKDVFTYNNSTRTLKINI